MRNVIILAGLFVSANAHSNVSDIFYFPANQEIISYTTYSTKNSELSGSINGVKTSITSNYSTLSQLFAVGLSDSVAVSIEAPYIVSGSSEIKVGSAKSNSDYNKSIQSPTFTVGKRIHLTDETNQLQYFDARLFFNPKASDDKSLRSDYLGLSLSGGMVISEDQKLSGSLGYSIFNANSNIESQTYTKLGLAYQKYINTNTFIQAAGDLSTYSEENYKTVSLKITYPIIPSIYIGFGRELKESNLDWRVSYQYYNMTVDIKSGVSKFNANYFGNTLSFNLGYKF